MGVKSAVTAFRMLNGLFCVYKPAKMTFFDLKNGVKEGILDGLRAMEPRACKKKIIIDGCHTRGEELKVSLGTRYSDHQLVVGPRYQMKDLALSVVNYVGYLASGVTVIGVGQGSYRGALMRQTNHMRVYELTAKFGFATRTGVEGGHIVDKSNWKNVKRYRFNSILAKIQSEHQQMMFKTSGLDIHSDDAYRAASSGLMRPVSRDTGPVLYSVKCTDFDPPSFTIEIACFNENPVYFAHLIHHIGYASKSTAYLCAVRCTRYANLTVNEALLQKEWSIENIINNIAETTHLFEDGKLNVTSPILGHVGEAAQPKSETTFLDYVTRQARLSKTSQ